jgi:hypothetical protein
MRAPSECDSPKYSWEKLSNSSPYIPHSWDSLKSTIFSVLILTTAGAYSRTTLTMGVSRELKVVQALAKDIKPKMMMETRAVFMGFILCFLSEIWGQAYNFDTPEKENPSLSSV